MTLEEAQLINGLHDRLDQNPPQSLDSEADRLISSRVASNPRAPYLLTQSVLVLQQAVTGAQTRIADLEKQLAEARSQAPQGGGSFLSGVANLFGSPPSVAPVRQATPAASVAPPPIPQQPTQGGSFLQTALGTAAGVAGGALLFQGIENLMGHNPGPFGGMGSGFGGGFAGGNQPTEIINNYYETPSQGDDQQDLSGGDDLQAQDDIADMTDDGGLFSSGDDDSSFV